MNNIFNYLNTTFCKRVFVILVFSFLLYYMKNMVNVLLLSVIFTLLCSRLILFLGKYIKLARKYLVIIIYLLVILIFYFIATNFVDELISQKDTIIKIITSFYDKPTSNDNTIIVWIANAMEDFDIKSQLQSWANATVSAAGSVGSMGISIFMAFVLSFFYEIESDKVKDFSKLFLKSKFGWFFEEAYFLGNKFTSTFGIVLETQFVIALINTILTVIGLYFLGFSQLLSLSALIFILGLIPVAGVVISSIPLAFIGYAIGGFEKVILIFVMILIIHAIEAYLLNPKLMSHKTNLPVFYVFLILYIAEHTIGVWGLIVGIPIFIFMLDLLEVKKIVD